MKRLEYPLCRHIRTNGLQCQSPALSGQPLCFFHSRLHRRHVPYSTAPGALLPSVPGARIPLQPLEDRESVQVAISLVINALAMGHLETRRATAILYGLQLASSNAARLDIEPCVQRHLAEPQSHDAADGLDLAQPGATGKHFL